MSGSLFGILHGLFGTRPSPEDLADVRTAQQQRLIDERLLPDDLSLDACDPTQFRVLVVGGGLAGLYAAWYLQQTGVEVHLFEAADRLGGRVLTDDQFIPGRVVEAGAELIGDNHAMWTAMAGRFDLELVPITKDEDYEADKLQVRFRFGDHDLDTDEKEQLYKDLIRVFDVIGQDASGIDPVAPWTSSGAEELDQMSVGERITKICEDLFGQTSKLPRAALEFQLSNDQCAPTEKQSYLALLAQVSAGRFPDPDAPDDPEGLRGYWNFTETCRCGGGNDQLVRRLSEPLDVHLNSRVTKVVIGEDGVRFTNAGEDAGEGLVDFVVLSAPPSVWPTIESPSGFDPTQFTMSHGPAVKYLASFPDKFWTNEGLAPKALWNLLGVVWESTDVQPDDGGDFGLATFSGGPQVLSEPQYPDRLDAIYPGFAPTTAMLVDWPNTSHIMTGYSVPSPGQVCTVGQALSVPFENRMFFAGEQSYVPFFGYMEGALQSGARAARDLIATICPDALQ